MSFLTRTAPLATKVSLGPTAGRAAAASVRPAFFSTSARRDKGPVETTKDTLKKADRTISDAAVKGLETGQKATNKIKGSFSHEAAKAEDQARRSAEEAKQQVKGKKDELKDEAKEESEEISGKA